MKPVVGALHNPRIMPGRDIVGIQRARAAPQAIELDLAIAHHARIRSAPAEILGNKVVDHTRGKVCAQIDHIKRKVHALGHPARIFEIVMRTTGAAPLRNWRGSGRLRREPHRNADDIVVLLAQNRRHTAGMISAAASISFAVLLQPRLILSELRASALLRPIARSTCDGSTAPAAQAEPIETSTPSRSSAISMLSPSTPGNVRLTVLGRRPTSGPFKRSPGIASRKRVNSDAVRESIRSDSAPIMFIVASAAAPNATAPSRFGVPARMPPSC